MLRVVIVIPIVCIIEVFQKETLVLPQMEELCLVKHKHSNLIGKKKKRTTGIS